jgi:hypothetical protein
MDRIGTAGEVAATVLWLLSAEASYITGTIVDVSAGADGSAPREHARHRALRPAQSWHKVTMKHCSVWNAWETLKQTPSNDNR